MQISQYGALTVAQFPCLADNYGFVLKDEETGQTAAVDSPDANAIAEAVEALGGRLDHVFNTHWHFDHIGGNAALKERFGAEIIAPREEGDNIPAADRRVAGGDTVPLGSLTAEVIATPGHTLGHIAYHFASQGVAFVGDTLFSLGCGRLFEGTPAQMWASLRQLRDLPADTVIYCAHEYTAANLAFARSLGEENPALDAMGAKVTAARAEGRPTVPTNLRQEQAANPFLRADDPRLAAAMDMAGQPADAVFAEVRRRKDAF